MDVATTWHSSGTCSLAPKEKGGVVDIHLKVYGMKNIRVADLSILPLLTVFIRKARFVTSGREASFLWSLLPISTTYGIADKLPTSSKRTMVSDCFVKHIVTANGSRSAAHAACFVSQPGSSTVHELLHVVEKRALLRHKGTARTWL